MLSRRDLLRLGAATASLSCLPSWARASQGQVDKLVIVFAYGGWDTTWVFDPKPDSELVEMTAGRWVDYGQDLPLWRPSGNRSDAHDFLLQYADRLAVINGVGVNSLVHETCVQTMLTGDTGPSHPPDIGARIAAALGEDLPLPYLLSGAGARPMELSWASGVLGYSNQLGSLLSDRLAYPTSLERFASPPEVEDAVAAYLEQSHAGLAVRRGGEANGRKLNDWTRSQRHAERIRESADGSFLTRLGSFYDYDPYNKAAAALAEGFSKAVFVQDGGYWDTHGFNDQQRSLHHDLFGNLGQLLSALESQGIAEETLVLVVSEMGRSPLINGTQGKDHWPFTTSLLLGPGVRSGLVQGTDDGLVQRPVDLATGAPDATGHRVSSSDVLATVATLMGVDAAAMYPQATALPCVMA
jgi:hypothetical protein